MWALVKDGMMWHKRCLWYLLCYGSLILEGGLVKNTPPSFMVTGGGFWHFCSGVDEYRWTKTFWLLVEQKNGTPALYQDAHQNQPSYLACEAEFLKYKSSSLTIKYNNKVNKIVSPSTWGSYFVFLNGSLVLEIDKISLQGWGQTYTIQCGREFPVILVLDTKEQSPG